MTDTILLVGHGSRDQNGNREVELFAQQWREQHPDWRIDLCFIEFADVLLDEGLAKASANSERVIVVPLILNAAGHVKVEIPHHIAKARAQFPQCQFVYVPHLGACDEMLAILRRRLSSGMAALDTPDPFSTGVILLGRGSSDRKANGEVAKMARWLHEVSLARNSRHELIDIAFTGITYPRLERVVQRQLQQGMMQIIILPYYLFTGTLIERIKRQSQALQKQYPQIRFHTADYLGFEREIFQLLDERVRDAKAGLHDISPYDAAHHDHDHDHDHDHSHGHHHHAHHQH
ncbi:MAG: sirohydrochlorin chelatase [Pseudomonadales bacterium]|nr:sirohydrochlorin chelatase [Pseudomonadales bacterium]